MNRLSKFATIPLAAVAMVAGGGLAGYTMLAHAQTPDTATASAATATPSVTTSDATKGGHVGANGMKEELLTGTTASSITAAALAAQPGATIERVETDAEGAAYEAHMTKADGTHITLKFDSSFNVTATETGGPGGHGHGGPDNDTETNDDATQ